VFFERINHIKVDCHVTCPEYNAKMIVLPYIRSNDQVADVFIKA